MIKAVVFDLDGTLLDTIPDITGALDRALASQGLPTHTVEACKTFIGGGIREAVRKAVPAGTPEPVQEAVLAFYKEDYRRRCTEGTECYPGVRELLAGLAAAGLPAAVLSNKTEATAQHIIRTYFPGAAFRSVHGRAEGRPLKPDPGAAAPVLEELGLPPEEIAYVGDSGTDIAFDTPRGGSIEGSIDSTGMTTAGATYADMELSRRDIRDMGGSVAMLSGSYEVRVQYRSEQNTTLLPSGAVRGSGEERFVYVVEQRQSAFGETSLVTRKQEVTVLAEAGGVASVQEDLSYIQVAYMEDREIGENTTVMEYVN